MPWRLSSWEAPQNYARVTSRWVLVEGGESFVSGHQPAPLILDPRHKISSDIPRQPCPPRLLRHDHGRSTDRLSAGHVFIDLEKRAHWPPMRWCGMKL